MSRQVSLQLIRQYQAKLERLIAYGGSRNETSVRAAFQELLDRYAASKNLALVTELEYKTRLGTTVRPDGTLKNAVRQDVGYWESKDARDDLDAEIALKLGRGYPDSNILFDDTQQVVLLQNGLEVGRASADPATGDPRLLHALLEQFVGFETPFVKTFREAIGRFQDDLPDLLETLREAIGTQAGENPRFAEKQARLLDLVQKAINPHLSAADVREMLIQHLLTEEIFTSVFNDAQFHRENNVARELAAVTETFFSGALRRNTLERIRPYYAVIQQAAVNIADHHEKQQFLKVIYETFYKAYNPAGADRLGIVYTPGEIVRFMVEAADHLTERHFGKLLGDEGVTILDPATGTGTFITEIIEYLPKAQLKRKYRSELFCNEVALLPYYTANLNIEYTYQQKMGEYAEFENIALVDTLENLDYVGAAGQFSMFELTAENLERIRRQNEQKISVIIGNPPYNALQMSENENNKNRLYPGIDNRIKATYVKNGSAQNKNKLYDMYARFLRWASDRIGENGIIAYIVNRSFVDSRTYDGFRKSVVDEFGEVYVVDLGGDVRANPKLSGTTHNVFGIQTGVAILFLVKKKKVDYKGKVFYTCRPEMERAKEKLEFLQNNAFSSLSFSHILPSKEHYWLNTVETDWEEFLPIASKDNDGIEAIFELFSLGIQTSRDEWAYDFSLESLNQKIRLFLSLYNADVQRLYGTVKKGNLDDLVNYNIKWSSSLKSYLLQGKSFTFDSEKIVESLYRPFAKQYLYMGEGVIHRFAHTSKIFPTPAADNIVINFMGIGSPKPFAALVTKYVTDLNFLSPAANMSRLLPLYRYDKSGNRLENITDWGLEQFRTHYGKIKTPGIVA